MARIVLNKAATLAFGAAEKVRVKVEDGHVMFRPTNRTKGLANLPKGEILVDLKRKSETSKSVTVPSDYEVPKMAVFEPGKYGWYVLVGKAVCEVRADELAGRVG